MDEFPTFVEYAALISSVSCVFNLGPSAAASLDVKSPRARSYVETCAKFNPPIVSRWLVAERRHGLMRFGEWFLERMVQHGVTHAHPFSVSPTQATQVSEASLTMRVSVHYSVCAAQTLAKYL